LVCGWGSDWVWGAWGTLMGCGCQVGFGPWWVFAGGGGFWHLLARLYSILAATSSFLSTGRLFASFISVKLLFISFLQH